VLEGSGYTLEEVRAAGGWVRIPAPLMEYKKWLKGRLRADGQPGFDTPTGLFEIRSSVLEEYGYEGLPKYTEPTEGPVSRPDLLKEFPLVFNSGSRQHTSFRSQDHGIAGLVGDHPEPVVELHRSDAVARRIADGDLVEVRTRHGAVPFRARVTEDIVPGAVECDMGGGTPVGPPAWREWNVNELTDLHNYDEISGFPVYKALLCDVAKLGGQGEAAAAPSACGAPSADVPLFRPASQVRPQRRIDLDNNATAPVADEVREAMLPFLGAQGGNPSSLHAYGRAAKVAIEEARRNVARLINARPRRMVFTGGGSEADNLAIKGVALAARAPGTHVITSVIEHPAILQSCRFCERWGIDVTYLPVDPDGLVDLADLDRALRDGTTLVSIQLANNEVGTIQRVKELAALAHARGVLFHTDAVQAVGRIPVEVEDLGVDLLTLAAHKFRGPKGVGALYVKAGVTLEPLIHGGSQEGGQRAGTENVAGIVGMGHAAGLALQSVAAAPDVARLRDELERAVCTLVPGARVNGHRLRRLPNTLNVTLPGLRGESVVVALDQHGVSLSSGSACRAGSPEPTHVLLAMGRTREESHCSVRFSLSSRTTADDVAQTATALAHVLREMETTVRFLPCK
jgi:cysteine desulfurase NifS